MAASVLRNLGWLRRRGLIYHIIEISPVLQTAQRASLGRLARRVCWHDDVAAALHQAQGRALIFSNEFVDAFPCAQITLDPVSGFWREVCVHWPDGAQHPQESFGTWPRAGWAAHASSALANGYLPGQRVEVHFSFRRWMKMWRHLWQGGRLLTIDYGDECGALYKRRPQGTLRAYCRHQRFGGLEIYERFGQQDLTADVNFTDLELWGEELGLSTAGLQTQRAFLQKWLPRQALRGAVKDSHLEFLLSEIGAGEAFKVLEQVARATA